MMGIRNTNVAGLVDGISARSWRHATVAVAFGFLLASGCNVGTAGEVSASGTSPALLLPTTPHLVVLMTDDLDSDLLDTALGLGFMPNLQQHILDTGVDFTESFVTNSLCCPSRATFLTGQYTHNHGVLSNYAPLGSVTAFDDSSTLGTALQGAGYRTGMVGKYLNGYGTGEVVSHRASDPTYVPPGWDDWQGLITPGAMFGHQINDNGMVITAGSAPIDYQTDVLSVRAVDFIRETVPLNVPMFLWITTFAPHVGLGTDNCDLPVGNLGRIKPAPRHLGSASAVPLPWGPSFDEADISDKPAWLRRLPTWSAYTTNCVQDVYRSQLESMRAVDDLLGMVVQELVAAGIYEDTVLVFTSDNGFMHGQHRLIQKGYAYEEAIRVPLMMRIPGIPGPATRDQTVLNNDLTPFLADLAGASVAHTVDGESLRAVVNESVTPAEWRTMFLVEHEQDGWPITSYAAVRTTTAHPVRPNWVYVSYVTGEEELYNINNDPYQLSNRNRALNSERRLYATDLLDPLRTCAGSGCRAAEKR